MADAGVGGGKNSNLRAASTQATPEGDIAINVIAKDRDGASLLVALQALGLKGGASFGAVVSGYIPASELGAVRSMANVASAKATEQSPRQPSAAGAHHHHKSDLDSHTQTAGASTGDRLHSFSLGDRVLPGAVVDPLHSSSVAETTNAVVAPADSTGDTIHAVAYDNTKVVPGAVDPLTGASASQTSAVAPADPTTTATPITPDPIQASSPLNSSGLEAVNIIAKDGNGSQLLSDLQDQHLIQGGASWGSTVSGYVKPSDLATLSSSTSNNIVSATPSASMTFAGSVDNQADQALHADVARSVSGVDGSGVTVGILSDSFNTSGNADTMATDIASGDLPQNTQILNDSPNGTDEGRAMAQIVHDIAPGAGIKFDTANGGDAVFAQHILDLANAGCKVIVDDVGYADELAYQDGVVAQAVNKVQAMGVTYLSAAGNAGTNGYEGAFTSSGTNLTYGGKSYTLDQFSPGVTRIPFTAASKELITLEWNQPGASAGGAGATSNLGLFLTDANGNVISNVASVNPNVGADPTQFLSLSGGSGSTGYLEVGLQSGAAPSDLRIIVQGGATLAPVAGETSNSTFFGHPAATGAIAVAAAPYNQTPQYGTVPPKAESFTSHGPDPVLFDTKGNPLPAVDNRQIDVTGVDGGETTFFYPGSTPGPTGHPTFYGTSAAAPSVAGVAALMLQKNPSLSPSQIQTILQNTADHTTVTSTGTVDSTVTGSGLVNAAAAVAAACFADGTRIRLADGADVAVEDLVVGDLVETASGDIRPIRWLGHRAMRPGEHRMPSSVQPVQVLAGAFGQGLPERDLMLSPGHPVLVGADMDNAGGYLVPIMCLVNGTTIRRVEVEIVTYWHIELDAHDVLLAEGLPAESYLDWGDRAFFLEGTDFELVNPDFIVPGLSARCRPVALDGPVVEAERRRLDGVFAMRLSSACAWPSGEDAPTHFQ